MYTRRYLQVQVQAMNRAHCLFSKLVSEPTDGDTETLLLNLTDLIMMLDELQSNLADIGLALKEQLEQDEVVPLDNEPTLDQLRESVNNATSERGPGGAKQDA